MAAQQITALDGTFLELEDADPSAHMHIGALLVFEPLPGADGGAPQLEDLAVQVDERIGLLPRYRQRLAGHDAGRMTWQHWEEDPDFHPLRHLRRAAIPEPGGWDELLEWAGTEFSRRLDRDRPLWEVVLVTGLADDRWALLSKTHHCLVDGVGSIDALALLVDTEPHPSGEPATADTHDDDGVLPLLLRGPLETVRAGLHAVTHPRETLRESWAVAELVVRNELLAAPDSSLNAPIGPRRALRGVRIGLDEARAIRDGLGGTVNDVALTAVTGGLRELLLSRGEALPQRGLRAMVPMNVRTEASAALGNRVSSLFADLPVADEELLARYQRVATTTADLKRSRAKAGADALLRSVEHVPPVVHQLLARSLYARRLFNVTVTNVPGPPMPLYAFGARMLSVWPLVPLAADHGVGVAIVSYDGQLVFGINADADSVPDIDVIAEGITATLRDLQHLALAVAR